MSKKKTARKTVTLGKSPHRHLKIIGIKRGFTLEALIDFAAWRLIQDPLAIIKLEDERK